MTRRRKVLESRPKMTKTQ
ncbi:hypothetical protein LEMLEM_LOCUS1683 [Lemmus lemmus]